MSAILAAIRADLRSAWRWILGDRPATLADVREEIGSATRELIDKVYDLELKNGHATEQIRSINERLIKLETKPQPVAAPEPEKDNDPARGWQRQRDRAEQGELSRA